MIPQVRRQSKDDSAYYTIWWSPLYRLTKDVVTKVIPSVSGIFEIYYDDGSRSLHLLGRSRAYYGGLRNTLRGLIDPDSPYPLNGELLNQDRPHFVRFALTRLTDDMDDVLYFFAIRGGNDEDADDSGRFAMIYVKEESLTPDGRPVGRA